MSVEDVANAFKSDLLEPEVRFFLKVGKARLGQQRRDDLLPDVQNLCKENQMVKTEDIEITQADFDKYKSGEVILIERLPAERRRKRYAKYRCTEVFFVADF